MSKIITSDDLIFLRETHFLSKNLAIYLKSMLNIDDSPIPFTYNQATSLKHRLKKKFLAARIFLETCKEAEMFSELDDEINFLFKGDFWNFYDIMVALNAVKRIQLDELDHQNKIMRFSFYPIKVECSILFNKINYTLFFLGGKKHDNVDKILFVLGPEYDADALKKDLLKIYQEIPKILVIPPEFHSKNVSNIIESNNLISLEINPRSLSNSDRRKIIKNLI